MDAFELYLSEMSIIEVSEETGIPKSTLRFRFAKAGILRSAKEGQVIAGKKGRMSRDFKRLPISQETRDKMSKAKTARGKGLSVKPNGYVEITMGPNKFRGQHVVIMEGEIGRRLFANECVHHINEIRNDNRIENLQLMTRSEHARYHALKRHQINQGKRL